MWMIGELFSRLDLLAYVHGVLRWACRGTPTQWPQVGTNFIEDQPDDQAARPSRFAIDVSTAAQVIPIDAACSDEGRLHCWPVVGIRVDSTAASLHAHLGDSCEGNADEKQQVGQIQCSAAAVRLVEQQASDVVQLPRSAVSLPAPVPLSLSIHPTLSAVSLT